MPKTKRIPAQLRHAKNWRAPRRRNNGTTEPTKPAPPPAASSEPLPGPHVAAEPALPRNVYNLPLDAFAAILAHALVNHLEKKPIDPMRFDSSKVRLAQPEANKFMGELFDRHDLTLPEGGFVLSSLLWATALRNTGNDPRMARELVRRTFDIFSGAAAPFAPVLLK